MVESIQIILESFISQLSSDNSSYVVEPDKDFTRSRKCSFQQMVFAILNMVGQTLSKELVNQDFPISKAAFVQNRLTRRPNKETKELLKDRKRYKFIPVIKPLIFFLKNGKGELK